MKPIKEMLGQKATNLSDQTITNNALATKAAASNAYLNAMLATATPELRQLFSASLTQTVAEHTGLSELAANKGWINPYEQPESQLFETFNQSKQVLNNHVTE